MKKKTELSVQKQTIAAMVEIAKLFPNQDPIRLAHGVIDFKLPIAKTLTVLRALAPHFKGENSDMIRIAAGFNNLQRKLTEEAPIKLPRKVTKEQAKRLLATISN